MCASCLFGVDGKWLTLTSFMSTLIEGVGTLTAGKGDGRVTGRASADEGVSEGGSELPSIVLVFLMKFGWIFSQLIYSGAGLGT